MAQATKYDWMLKRWAEQNNLMPKDSPDLTPADPNEAQLAQQKEPKPEPQAQSQQPMQPQQPEGQMGQVPPEDETEQISQMVGVVTPWEKVDLYLDNWEYRVWEGWIGKGPDGDQKADLLKDVLKQFDNDATVVKGPSKSDPNAMTYSFKFSLGGSPDGVVDAVTKINEAFLALDNYKVISGKMYAIVYYANGEENTMDLTPQLRGTRNEPKGVDINDAVQMALDAVTKSHAPESQWQRPKTCPECGEQLPNSNDEIAQHYLDYHPNADVEKLFQEEEEEGRWDDKEHSPAYVEKKRPPKPTNKDWAEIIKPEEANQVCKHCGAPIETEGWTVCSKCVADINAGEQAPKTEAGGMPDLSYRSSPMGVQSVHTDEIRKPMPKPVHDIASNLPGQDLPGAQTTEFDSMGRPITERWEDEELYEKTAKILGEVENIYREHEFYSRINSLLDDLGIITEYLETPKLAAPQSESKPEVVPHLQSAPVGPKSEVNNQTSSNPSGGQPHNYTQGKMGQCAICGLPATHYAHYGR